MKRILVLGSGGSAAINFISALRMAPEQFYIVGADLNRYNLEVPDVNKRYHISTRDDKEYIERVNRIIDAENIEFIHAQPDEEVRKISEFRDVLKAKTFLPSKDAVRICQDKMACNDVLSRAGVPVPKSFSVTGMKHAERNFRDIGGKVWIRARKGAAGNASLPVTTFDHAKLWMEYWVQEKNVPLDSFMLCEYLPGNEVSWVSVWNHGELICSQARTREGWVKPNPSPSGISGTTAVQRTVHRDDINEIATKTVRAVDKVPNGIYVVDTKENASGVPCVTELNIGRFYTTSGFFPHCGVNMPYIFVKLAYGEKPPQVKKYNAVDKDIFWIRVLDGKPVKLIGQTFTSVSI